MSSAFTSCCIYSKQHRHTLRCEDQLWGVHSLSFEFSNLNSHSSIYDIPITWGCPEEFKTGDGDFQGVGIELYDELSYTNVQIHKMNKKNKSLECNNQ